MDLARYLRDNDLDDESFAVLGAGAFSAEAVRKWRFGVRVPRPEHISLIAKLTDGQVTANDLVAGHAGRIERRRERLAS